jgi:hypothetical protein
MGMVDQPGIGMVGLVSLRRKWTAILASNRNFYLSNLL